MSKKIETKVATTKVVFYYYPTKCFVQKTAFYNVLCVTLQH